MDETPIKVETECSKSKNYKSKMTSQQIINFLSLSSAVKAIKLNPIIKRGEHTEVGNYQPVSVLLKCQKCLYN